MIDTDRLPVLAAQRVSLRGLEMSDVPDLFAVFSNAAVMRYWSSPAWLDESAGVKLVNDGRRGFEEKSLYLWGVADQQNQIVGTCALNRIDSQNQRAEIGFILRQDLWGQGLMSEALHSLLQFAFDDMQLIRIEADVDPRNDASIGLLKRFEFQQEGYLRQRWIVGGEICDTALFGLLRTDWTATRPQSNQIITTVGSRRNPL